MESGDIFEPGASQGQSSAEAERPAGRPEKGARRPGRGRRMARLLLFFALLVAFAPLLLLGLSLVSHTEWGGKWLARQVSGAAAGRIAGELSVGRLSLSLPFQLSLETVELKSPPALPGAGDAERRVARLERLDASLEPLALLRREVRLTRVAIEGGGLWLVPVGEEAGAPLNLTAALAPPPPSSEPREAREARERRSGASEIQPYNLVVEELALRDLHFEYRSAPGAAPSYSADNILVSARGRSGLSKAESAAELAMEVTCHLTAPLDDSLALGLRLGTSGDSLEIQRLALDVGGQAARAPGAERLSRLLAKGEVARWRSGQPRLSLAIEELWVAPSLLAVYWPGTLFHKTLRAQGTGSVDGEGAAIALTVQAGRGEIALSSRAVWTPFAASAEGALQGAELEAIMAAVPPSELNGTLMASYGEGVGAFAVALAPSKVRGAQVERLELRFELRSERLEVERLLLLLPGARLEGSGGFRGEALHASARLRLRALEPALGSAARAAGADAGALSQLSGGGELSLRAHGTLTAPALSVKGAFEQLSFGAVEVRALTLDGAVPNLRRPLAFEGELSAASGMLNDLPFHALRALVKADRRSFELELSSAGLAGLIARARGDLPEEADGAGQRVKLSMLSLGAGDANWELERPTTLRFAGGRLEFEPFALTSVGGQRIAIEGRLAGARTELALSVRGLELALLPALLVPRSVGLTGRLSLDGKLSRQVASATFELLHGTWAEALAGSASLPLALFEGDSIPASDERALSAELTAKGISLGSIGKLGATGVVEARLSLSGTLAKPALSLRAEGEGLQVGALEEVTLDVALDSADQLKGEVRASLLGGGLRAELSSPSSLRELVTRARAAAVANGHPGSLLDLPLELTLWAEGLHASALADPVGSATWESVLGARGHFSGTARAPRGELSFSASLSADSSALGFAARSAEAQRLPLGAADAPITGVVRGTLSVGGTLEAPKLSLTAGLDDMAMGEVRLGALSLGAHLDEGKVEGSAEVLAEAGGALHARGWANLPRDLSGKWAADAVPFGAALTASQLNLSLLSAPLGALLRRAGGVLDADLTASGTLGAPSVKGILRIADGSVVLPGPVAYRDLELELSIDEALIELRRLSLSVGKGRASLTARAARASPEQPYRMEGELALDAVPIVVDEQVAAVLTLRSEQLSGLLQRDRLTLDARLGRIGVYLPQLGTKDLQSLERHGDFSYALPGQVKVKEQREGGEQERAQRGEAKARAFEATIHLLAKKGILVESEDVRIEALAELELRLANGALAMSGEVGTTQGRIDAMGRLFTLRRGRLTYAQDPPGNPSLELRATHVNEREGVTVDATVTGTARRPKLELTSDPPLDEAEIAALLATGRRELERGSGGVASGTQAASIVGAFAAERLRKSVAAQLPIDVLQVELEGGTLAESRVEAGSYVTDRVYVGYRHNFGAQAQPNRRENTNEVRLQYRLTPRLSLEASGGDYPKGGLDVVFRRDY